VTRRQYAAAWGHTGLFHVAIRYPDRGTLADALRRLIAAGVPLEGASDHGVSEALYLNDPDSPDSYVKTSM
jgi:catechol 2,3-dioxygenase